MSETVALISSSRGYFLLKDNKLIRIGSKINAKESFRQNLIIDLVIFWGSGFWISKSVGISNILEVVRSGSLGIHESTKTLKL